MIKNLLPAVRRKNDKALRQAGEHPFLPIQREMNRLFDDFFRDFNLKPLGKVWTSGFEPSMDVWENDKKIHIKAELPGLDEKDIDVTLTPDALTIRGEKKEEKEDKGNDYWYKETSYGSFQRSIALPEGIHQEKVEAKFKNGVLHIEIPWLEGARPGKKITVKTS
ncbi:MAG TPA: Hsp20/alpha crystallin family protein [Smithellaceae bacterium]|mgnify:CR=1 FL=1|nr:Hsp20/alpha crystallin family protein [Smithellaceae bacterium]